MPPRVRITKEEIVQAALGLVRSEGGSMPCARSIAAALGCSTQPIFSNFSSMEALEEAVGAAAYEHYWGFLMREVESGAYPRYKAFGMAYIRFAKEEKALFKLLFMCDRRGQGASASPDFEAAVTMIMEANHLTRERAELLHLEMWSCVHGIGTMLVTSFFSPDWELISRMLTDIYQGLRERHLKEEAKA